jgi:hypothetical protein
MPKLVYFVSDLLFVSKIRETASQLGFEAIAGRDAQMASEARIIVVDLRPSGALELLDRLSDYNVPKVGFIDHERTEVMEAAQKKGCRALAKGQFSTELPKILAAHQL